MNTDDDRKLLMTRDGSYTIEQASMGVTFHSKHGAVQESMHVFIREGLQFILSKKECSSLSIFEMGFGTGLNALLTYFEAKTKNSSVHYTSVDLFPLPQHLISELGYDVGATDSMEVFKKLHAASWNIETAISPFFTLMKMQQDLLTFESARAFDLIFFDAFGPVSQPELWSAEVFQKMHSILHPDGVFVTYSSKGDVRRALQASGFLVEKLPGPPGKREMVRATKNR